MIIVAMAAVVVAGCAGSSSTATDGFSSRSRVIEKTRLIRATRKSLRTASCKRIDEAMAYSYLLQRTLTDKKVVRKRSDATRGAALIYRGAYSDFRKEHKRRCKGEALRTRTMQKMYPDIMREARRRRRERLESASARVDD